MQQTEINKLRQRVYKAVDKAIQDQRDNDNGFCHHKSYEGAITIETWYPNTFEKENKPKHQITIHAYVIGPHRHYDFEGKTLKECINKAHKQLTEWGIPQ